jgi:Tol biopolymer transport system component
MITFTSDRGGSHQIYVMDSDGSNQRQLTSGFDRADDSAYSPDGTKIAFNGSRDGKPTQIYVMSADGSDQTQLTNQAGIPSAPGPSWSPDGAQIAFTVGHGTCVINADGSDKHMLRTTGIVGATGMIESADWSPDGTKFVFKGNAEDPDRMYGLFVIDAAGSEGRRLTRGYHESPVWSPDGQRIAFNGPGPLGSGLDIYVMNADGSGVTTPTDGKAARAEPDWSPDGQKFAFHRSKANNIDIYVMNADGSGEARLTSDPGHDLRPNWHPKQRRRPVPPGPPEPPGPIGPINPGISG